MKKMFLGGLMIFLASSCSVSEKQSSQNIINEGITKVVSSGTVIFTLKDHLGERTQPNSRFYGNKDQQRVDELSPTGEIASSIHSFLIEKDGKKGLFDTGLGQGGRLWEHLKTLKVNPEEIDFIFLTHMHGDHIGGMLDGENKVFPNAQIFVSQPEYNFWIQNKESQAFKVLEKYENQLHKFDYSKNLPLGVKPIEAHGHTPGHSVFEIGKMLIIGDLMHGMELQLKDPSLNASYDMDKEKSILARKKILSYAEKNKKIILGMHLPNNGVSSIYVQ